jgi:hypothetical protein
VEADLDVIIAGSPKPEEAFPKLFGRKTKENGRKIQGFFFRESNLFKDLHPIPWRSEVFASRAFRHQRYSRHGSPH